MSTWADGSPQAACLALARVSELWPGPVDPGQQPAPAPAGWTAAEYQRLRAISAPRRRAQFIAGRLLLRCLLRHLLPPAREFSISASELGPPCLEDRGHGAPPLHLALSHSGDWVCAAAAPVPVGLDLETTEGRHRTRDWSALVGLAGSPAERDTLAALGTPSEQGRFFLTLWTLKEAWFKQQARPLDAALLPHLHTAPTTDAARCNAWVWQTEDCTLALAWSAATPARSLPVHWVCARTQPVSEASSGFAHPLAPPSTMPWPALARQAARPWQVGLIKPS